MLQAVRAVTRKSSKRNQPLSHAELVLLHRSITAALSPLGLDHKRTITFFVAQCSVLVSQTCASMYRKVLTETSQVRGTNGKFKRTGGVYLLRHQ